MTWCRSRRRSRLRASRAGDIRDARVLSYVRDALFYSILHNNQQVTRTQDTPTEKTPPTPAHTRARMGHSTVYCILYIRSLVSLKKALEATRESGR